MKLYVRFFSNAKNMTLRSPSCCARFLEHCLKVQIDPCKLADCAADIVLHTHTHTVPPRPQDGTVSVIVLFTIVFGCMTDCNLTFNTVRCPCNGLVREVSP